MGKLILYNLDVIIAFIGFGMAFYNLFKNEGGD